jgi:DNA polymerase
MSEFLKDLFIVIKAGVTGTYCKYNTKHYREHACRNKMPILDNRKMEILAKMGIQLWKLRQDPDTPPAIGEELPGQGNHSSDALPQSPATTKAAPDRLELAGEGQSAKSISDYKFASLDEISFSIGNCERCPLHATRINTVPGHGNTTADWMFVGEGPGQNEDEQGLPFVGRAGQLLNAMISALGMRREDVFVANAVKCRPPGNRDPSADELAECEPYLHQQLTLIRPRVIVALGRISAQALLKTGEPLGKLRGTVHRYGPRNVPLVVTYHPAYLLRSPDQKLKSWQDLLLAKSIVNQSPP